MKVIEKNEIKTKLQDELIILKDKEMEPVTKTESVPFPNSEETSTKVEAIAESKLLPTLTKEEISIDMEFPTAVSMEDSFQPPTIYNEKDLKDDTISLTVPEPYIKPAIEKIKTEEARVEELIDYTDKEEIVVPKIEKEEQEVTNHVERNEKNEKDTYQNASLEIKIEERKIENEKADEVLPVTEIEESEFVEKIIEKSKEISQLDKTEITDIKEIIPHMEIIKTNEFGEVSPIPEMEKVEQDAEKTILTVDVKEIKEIIPETISPVDIIEIQKFESDKTVLIKKDDEAAELPPITDIAKKEILLSHDNRSRCKIRKQYFISRFNKVYILLEHDNSFFARRYPVILYA